MKIMDAKQEMILIIAKYCGVKEKLNDGLEVFIYKDGIEKMVDELVDLLPKHFVSGISLEQLKLQKECYRERKERNGKATAYGEAHTEEIREGVIDHLIALCNYR